MIDEEVYRGIVEAAAGGRLVAVATVLRTKGSVPRHAGSRMIVDPQRGLIGTIGGGQLEFLAIGKARQMLRDSVSRFVAQKYDFDADSVKARKVVGDSLPPKEATCPSKRTARVASVGRIRLTTV